MGFKSRLKEIITILLNNIHERRKLLLALSCAVVFLTTYVLILPAFTLDKEEASEQGGIDVPGVEQTVDADTETESDTAPADEAKETKRKKDEAESAKVAGGPKQSKAALPVTLQNEESGDYIVAVEGDEAVLSEDMSVSVREIDQSTKKLKKEYDSLYNDALEAVQKAQKEEGLDQPSDFAFA